MLLAPLLAASSSNHSRQLNWFPCVEAGRCGTSVSILPDHELIHYRGYVTLDRSQQKARFDRAPFGEGSVLQLISPAASIRFRTNAHRVIVVLEYRGKKACDADCPLVRTRPASSKGLLDWGGCYAAKPCPNQCDVQLEIDGQPASGSWTNLVDLPLTGKDARLDFLGEVKLHAYEQEQPSPRTLTLRLPWGAPVDLKRILLETLPAELTPPQLLPLPPPPTVKLVAMGDSITAGWCDLSTGGAYPRQLAEAHGWDHTNLGVAGAGIVAAHGTAAGRLKADLLTIMLGVEEWQACAHDLTEPMTQLLAAIRAEQPSVPLVVVTPTVSWREGVACSGPAGATPQQQRAQIGIAVTARQRGGDSDLYLISGLQILPKAYVGDGVHPTDLGQREIALNLDAEMGFAPVQFVVKSCPPLVVAVRGLVPGQWFDLHWGVRAEAPTFVGGDNPEEWQGCKGRSLMLTPYGKVAGVASDTGEATVTVDAIDKFDSCHEAVFEVLEAGRCTNSRLGQVSSSGSSGWFDSREGTPAERWSLPLVASDAAAAAVAVAEATAAVAAAEAALAAAVAHAHPQKQPQKQPQQPQPAAQPQPMPQPQPQPVAQPQPQPVAQPVAQPQPQSHASAAADAAGEGRGKGDGKGEGKGEGKGGGGGGGKGGGGGEGKGGGEGEAGGKGKGVACASNHPGDTREEGCAGWCRGDHEGHCEWCKCRGCASCAASAATSAEVQLRADEPGGISGGDDAVNEAPDDGEGDEAARRQHLLRLAAAGAASGLLFLCATGLVCACCRCLRRHVLQRRGKRYQRAFVDEDDAPLVPAHFEVAGTTQVLAVQLDAARSLKELRELLADSYLEVFDVELLAPKMVIEFEDQSGCFVRVVDSAPIRAGRLLTALSVHVTASVR